jgi:hypothetical protein
MGKWEKWKNGFGYILGYLFKNSSGHSALGSRLVPLFLPHPPTYLHWAWTNPSQPYAFVVKQELETENAFPLFLWVKQFQTEKMF